MSFPPTSEEDVEKTLLDLRESKCRHRSQSKRAAQPGDEITIKLSGKRTQPADGGGYYIS